MKKIKLFYQLLFLLIFLCLGETQAAPAGWPPKWLDLPANDYAQLLKFPPSPELTHLSELSFEYNAIPKTEYTSLDVRIEKLEAIITFISNFKEETENPLLKKHLSALITVGKNKAWYLSQLKEGYETGRLSLEYNDSVIKELTGVGPENINDHIIFLHRNDKFNPVVVEYWGDFWLEYIDPCHRKLWSYLALWKKQKENTPQIPPFFLWLEDQNLSIDVPFMHYCNSEELANCLVEVKDGHLFYQLNGKTVGNEGPIELLFYVSLEKEIYVAKGTPTIHHTSLTHGKPVLAVGGITVDNGKITYLAFESGHHLPTIIDGKEMIKILREIELDLPDELIIGFYNEFGKHHINLYSFMIMNEETLTKIEG